MNKQAIVCLVGPTASGKTACIEHVPPDAVELISADSMQAYRGMDIGTAKPSKKLQARIPHHLIDILDPDEQYHVAEFVRQCQRLIPEIHKRGRLPLIVGGTAFYIRTLLYGMPDTPPPNAEIRDALQKELLDTSVQDMHEKLQSLDPESAERIHANDTHRVLRALEIYYSTGKPRSSFTANQSSSSYTARIAGISVSREMLKERIYERTAHMFQSGLPEEVLALREKGYTAQSPGMRAIGYREFLQYTALSNLPELQYNDTITAIQEKISYNSLQYAKRQMVFFSRMKEITWFNRENTSELCDYILT